jgi:hypothetical protein
VDGDFVPHSFNPAVSVSALKAMPATIRELE